MSVCRDQKSSCIQQISPAWGREIKYNNTTCSQKYKFGLTLVTFYAKKKQKKEKHESQIFSHYCDRKQLQTDTDSNRPHHTGFKPAPSSEQTLSFIIHDYG